MDHSLLDIATNTGRYLLHNLLHKRQNLRSLNQAYKFDILKKTQQEKNSKPKEKLNNSGVKLKDSTKFHTHKI